MVQDSAHPVDAGGSFCLTDASAQNPRHNLPAAINLPSKVASEISTAHLWHLTLRSLRICINIALPEVVQTFRAMLSKTGHISFALKILPVSSW